MGNNNGTVNGHKYFECAPEKGVLVIPSKVMPKLIHGVQDTVGANVDNHDDGSSSSGKASTGLAEGCGGVGLGYGGGESPQSSPSQVPSVGD